MKQIFRRFAAVFLIFALTTQIGAAVLGEALRQDSLPLTAQSNLTESTYFDAAGTIRKEAVLTYVPSESLRPQVVYGTTLYGRSTMDTLEAYPETWGFSVVAGVNGAFFDMASGIPYGCVITDGAVRTSGNLEAIGFREDGTAIIGVPELSVQIQLPTKETPTEIHVNKVLTKTGGMVLYTRDYDSHTKNEIPAYNLVLMPDTPDLVPGSTLTCTVTEILPDTADCPIPAGGFVLSMAAETEYIATLETYLKPLLVGDTATVTISVAEAWQDVVSACAGMEILIENGEVKTEFTLSSAKSRSARTAVGLKADGALVLYTADSGRGAVGLTLAELALRMQELGCVTALNLDGGGSTAIRALYPGMMQTQTVNKPSDGQLRKCANFLFLTRPKAEPGEAAMLFAYPHNAIALPGGQIPMTIAATDAEYISAPVPETVTVEATGGVYSDGVFTAEAVGDAVLTLQSDSAQGSVTVRVIETPDAITVLHEADGKTAGGSIISGETLALTASAQYAADTVYSTDESFVWTCDSAIGTVDETGLFTAATVYVPTTGIVTCAAGETTKEVPITVLPDNPFPDTENHWAKDFVRTMYDAGVLKGSELDGIPHFRPDDAMTRQEFLVSLIRHLDAPLQTTELPFADNDAIAPWAYDAVMTAYCMELLTGSQVGDALYCAPTQSITRQQAMVILSRTLPQWELTEDVLAVFSDAETVAAWATDGLGKMVSLGIISGMPDGTLDPNGTVTRGQVAKMLAVMRQLPDTENRDGANDPLV